MKSFQNETSTVLEQTSSLTKSLTEMLEHEKAKRNVAAAANPRFDMETKLANSKSLLERHASTPCLSNRKLAALELHVQKWTKFINNLDLIAAGLPASDSE